MRKHRTSNIEHRTPKAVVAAGSWTFHDGFVHKLKICLKELRETRRWARLIQRKGRAKNDSALLYVLSECDVLIRVFCSSIQTARKNALVQKHRVPDAARYPSATAG